MTEQSAPLLQPASPNQRSGFVAIIGKPNVGKSTLLNAWVGLRIAAVTPKPQTTRNRLLGIITREDAQVILVDTPGIHEPRTKLGSYMLETALSALRDADVVLFLVDGSEPPTRADEAIAETLRHISAPVVLVINKADLKPSPDFIQAYSALGEWREIAHISALKAQDTDELLERVVALLPYGPRYYPEDQTTDQQERYIAAELIREQALLLLDQEVPHGLAVAVDEFKERENGDVFIAATIVCEKDSHKGIIIGKGGARLKTIGSRARKELEQLLDTRVFLELWIKVRPNWRKNEHILRELGYALDKDR
ncbi:MAG: GTPase Era [Chloroflexi bacterium]|nr:GTPase Era [Chloroflexota bacterium]